MWGGYPGSVGPTISRPEKIQQSIIRQATVGSCTYCLAPRRLCKPALCHSHSLPSHSLDLLPPSPLPSLSPSSSLLSGPSPGHGLHHVVVGGWLLQASIIPYPPIILLTRILVIHNDVMVLEGGWGLCLLGLCGPLWHSHSSQHSGPK